MNTINALKQNPQYMQMQENPNAPKGFYTPPNNLENKHSQEMATSPQSMNNINNNQQGFSSQPKTKINPNTNINQMQMPSYPSVTNYNIQNYNFNNYNTNAPSSNNSTAILHTPINQNKSYKQQFISNHSKSPSPDESNKFSKSNLNLTTAKGKSINISKTATIPINNALKKTGQKLRVNLSGIEKDSSDIFSNDFIPLKTYNNSGISGIYLHLNNIDVGDTEASESLKNYIQRSFDKCANENDRKKTEQALQRIILNAKKKGQLIMRNWTKFPLPKLPNEIEDMVNNSIYFIVIII